MDGTPKVPRFPLCRIANNPTTRVALNYSIVDYLDQPPSTMFALEVLRTCPSQCKALLSALCVVDSSGSWLNTSTWIKENLGCHHLYPSRFLSPFISFPFIDASSMRVHPLVLFQPSFGRSSDPQPFNPQPPPFVLTMVMFPNH